MKKNVLLGILISLLLVGCGNSVFPGLPDDAIAFETKYMVEESSNDFYCYELEYNGRQYLEYGDTKGFLNKKNIDKCVG